MELLPQTDGYLQLSRRHDLHDRGDDPLSAPTDHRSDHADASAHLSEKQGENITDQIEFLA